MSIIRRVIWALRPKDCRRYTVRFRSNEGGDVPARSGAEVYGGKWSEHHMCWLHSQPMAEWYCYVRNNDGTLPYNVHAYVTRII